MVSMIQYSFRGVGISFLMRLPRAFHAIAMTSCRFPQKKFVRIFNLLRMTDKTKRCERGKLGWRVVWRLLRKLSGLRPEHPKFLPRTPRRRSHGAEASKQHATRQPLPKTSPLALPKPESLPPNNSQSHIPGMPS